MSDGENKIVYEKDNPHELDFGLPVMAVAVTRIFLRLVEEYMAQDGREVKNVPVWSFKNGCFSHPSLTMADQEPCKQFCFQKFIERIPDVTMTAKAPEKPK